MADQWLLKRFREKLRLSTIIIHIILCLIVLMLMIGCSHSHSQASALWAERRIDDDQRIYENPYESLNREPYIQFHTTF